jgi:FkbM family methyltransferase
MYKENATAQIEGLPEIYQEHLGYKTDGYFVEVGAFNGYNWSNTEPLASVGWSGLLVEPQPELYAECVRFHESNPGVVVENVACGPYHGNAKLYLAGSLSTLYKDVSKVYSNTQHMDFTGHKAPKTIDVEVFTLDELLEKHNALVNFDVLVVDVEGAEMDVWKY